jgi:Spy/CpxP family protein refolding chaperone
MEDSRMKLFRFVLLAMALTVSLSALAQMGMGQGGGRHGQGQMPSVDDRVKQLTKQLDLNSDQQKQVRSILQDQMDQMQKLRDDNSTPREERRPKMMQIHQGATDKIRALLNDDQKKKFDAMQQQQRERFQQGRGGNRPSQGDSQSQGNSGSQSDKE